LARAREKEPGMSSEETMSTAEAAARLGVSANVLRDLASREAGYLTPRSEGFGRGRRLFWSEKDLKEARDLMNQESTKSRSDATIDLLGGADFLIALK